MRSTTDSLEHHPLLSAARLLEPRDVYLLFSHEAHFRNPLVTEEWAALQGSSIVDDGKIEKVVEELLLARQTDLPRGLYFPAPMARSDPDGASAEELLDRFHYEMIHVDEEQVWRWRGHEVAERTRLFFLEHLRWQPEIERFYFEYRVNDDWWDKSYLDADVTPLVVRQMEEVEDEAEGVVEVLLGSGQRDRLDLDSFRLDERERLFCRSDQTGDVMFSEALRFRLLRDVSEDLTTLRVVGAPRPLAWP